MIFSFMSKFVTGFFMKHSRVLAAHRESNQCRLLLTETSDCAEKTQPIGASALNKISSLIFLTAKSKRVI